MLNVGDEDMGITADIPSAGELLSALRINPRNPGTFGLNASVSSKGVYWESDVKLTVGDSTLEYTAEFDLNRENPVIGRRIGRDLIRIADVRDIVSMIGQIRRFNSLKTGAEQNGRSNSDLPEHGYVVQPLVLMSPEDSEFPGSAPSNNAAVEDNRVVQPLVLVTPAMAEASASEAMPDHGNFV